MLPEFCFSEDPCKEKIVILVNGCEVYYLPETTNGKSVKELNEMIGVTELEEDCMLAGSMMGLLNSLFKPN